MSEWIGMLMLSCVGDNLLERPVMALVGKSRGRQPVRWKCRASVAVWVVLFPSRSVKESVDMDGEDVGR